MSLSPARNLVLVALAGAAAGIAATDGPHIAAMFKKSIGRDEPCPWSKLVFVPWTGRQFQHLKNVYTAAVRPTGETDPALGIQRFHTPTRPFWLKQAGDDMDAKALLTFVLAEEDLIMAHAGDYAVKPGDVVVDVGGHVGTFGDDALRRGAAKVIMIEPDPVNVECIRRNFPKEIAEGRVIVVPEGAWSSPGTLDFAVGIANSGTGSFVLPEAGARVLKVKTRPLDDMLSELGISHVDFIKMDIEGAEREALKGAARTLRTSRPRLMLDMYHRLDDAVVLPQVIHAANPAYADYCALCSVSRYAGDSRLIPYATFFR